MWTWLGLLVQQRHSKMADDAFHFFLRLPRDIRDNIYRHVLNVELQPLISPVDGNGKCYKQNVRNQYGDTWSRWRSYQQTLPWVSSHQLMRCSHQLRQEVRESLSQKKTQENLRYKLDLVTWNSNLRSTWLSIPAPLKHMRHFEINVRFFRQGNVDWGFVNQDLALILARFFKSGLRLWLSRDNNQGYHPQDIIQADTLTVNIIAMLFPLGSITNTSFERAVVAEPGPAHLEPRFDETTAQFVSDRLQNLLVTIAKAGYLYGKFSRVKLCYRTWAEELDITDQERYDGRWAPGRNGLPINAISPLPQGSMAAATVVRFPASKGLAAARKR